MLSKVGLANSSITFRQCPFSFFKATLMIQNYLRIKIHNRKKQYLLEIPKCYGDFLFL